MVVSPCTTFTLPAKVASFDLSRTSSEAASIWIGLSRFCEKPCIAFGTPCIEFCAHASPSATAASAHATAHALRAICRRKLKEKIMLASLRGGRLAAAGRARLRLFRRRGFRLIHGQVHHHIALEAHDLAAVDDLQPV